MDIHNLLNRTHWKHPPSLFFHPCLCLTYSSAPFSPLPFFLLHSLSLYLSLLLPPSLPFLSLLHSLSLRPFLHTSIFPSLFLPPSLPLPFYAYLLHNVFNFYYNRMLLLELFAAPQVAASRRGYGQSQVDASGRA